MRNVFARCASAAALVALAGLPSRAEDYQCQDQAGCVATITDEDGVVQEVVFREGDLISTESGWVVSTDDGWAKVNTKDKEPMRAWMRF